MPVITWDTFVEQKNPSISTSPNMSDFGEKVSFHMVEQEFTETTVKANL